MIAIINYGLGNVKAFANVYKKLDIPARIANTPVDLEDATKIILPGVGAFDFAMHRLNNSGLREIVEQKVLIEKLPVLGVCVGMQILAQSSEEGSLSGLGWIDGTVKKFCQNSLSVKMNIPHMGWNNVQPTDCSGLFREIGADSRFYFLHSYYFVCKTEKIIAFTDYFGNFACSINSKNIYGVQFHPEKSHEWGVKLLRNFANL